jgi:hypothetical protein
MSSPLHEDAVKRAFLCRRAWTADALAARQPRDSRVTAAEDRPYTAVATLNNLRQREHSSDERARVRPWEIPFERMSSVRKQMPRLTGTQRTRR